MHVRSKNLSHPTIFLNIKVDPLLGNITFESPAYWHNTLWPLITFINHEFHDRCKHIFTNHTSAYYPLANRYRFHQPRRNLNHTYPHNYPNKPNTPPSSWSPPNPFSSPPSSPPPSPSPHPPPNNKNPPTTPSPPTKSSASPPPPSPAPATSPTSPNAPTPKPPPQP